MQEPVEHLIALGREHYTAGEYDRAEPYLTEAITGAHVSFPDVYNMLGVIYHAQGRFSQAEAAFETALRLNPRYTEAALNLSVTYNDRGKYERAREVYTQAIAASLGPVADGDRTVTKSFGDDPFARGKLANMHADLGAAYAGLGMFEEAAREYRHALGLCPDFVDLRVKLGNVYRDLRAFDAAITEFEHAKRQRPDFVPARIHLGVTLFSLGDKASALAEWQAVLDIDPDHKSAQLYIRMVNDAHGPRPGSALEP